MENPTILRPLGVPLGEFVVEISKDIISDVFQIYDESQTKSVNLNSITNIMKELGADFYEDEILQAFEAMDPNNEGKVRFDVFYIWWVS